MLAHIVTINISVCILSFFSGSVSGLRITVSNDQTLKKFLKYIYWLIFSKKLTKNYKKKSQIKM